MYNRCAPGSWRGQVLIGKTYDLSTGSLLQKFVFFGDFCNRDPGHFHLFFQCFGFTNGPENVWPGGVPAVSGGFRRFPAVRILNPAGPKLDRGWSKLGPARRRWWR